MYGMVCCVYECLYICMFVMCVHVMGHAFGMLVFYVPSSV